MLNGDLLTLLISGFGQISQIYCGVGKAVLQHLREEMVPCFF